MATPRNLPEGFIGIDEAAARLGIQPRTLYAWRHRRKGPRCERHNGLLAYRPEWIDEYLAGTSAPTETGPAEREARPSIRVPAAKPRRSAPQTSDRHSPAA
jgi:hypothetical protein